MATPSYYTSVATLPTLTAEEIQWMSQAEKEFPFRTTSYYVNLINWNDPNDALRNIVLPNRLQLCDNSSLDVSDELLHTPIRGVQHKFRSTCLILVTDACAAYCRFCFRKRLFADDNEETRFDIEPALSYITSHREIDNVLLTGGDPLIASINRLRKILTRLANIAHVRIVRLGTRMPAFDPCAVSSNRDLLDLLQDFNTEKQAYIMVHFDHPRELTTEALKCLDSLVSVGCAVSNQTPLLANVNDNATIIRDLFNTLAYHGIPPYYLLHCKPTRGNLLFRMPIRSGLELFSEARKEMNGLAARARYIMVNKTGKIEIVGFLDNNIVFRCHEAAEPELIDRIVVANIPHDQCWFNSFSDLTSA